MELLIAKNTIKRFWLLLLFLFIFFVFQHRAVSIVVVVVYIVLNIFSMELLMAIKAIKRFWLWLLLLWLFLFIFRMELLQQTTLSKGFEPYIQVTGYLQIAKDEGGLLHTGTKPLKLSERCRCVNNIILVIIISSRTSSLTGTAFSSNQPWSLVCQTAQDACRFITISINIMRISISISIIIIISISVSISISTTSAAFYFWSQ